MRKRNKQDDTRFKQVMAAITDERARFNAAIHQDRSKRVLLTTHSGQHIVDYVTSEHWYRAQDVTSGLWQSWCGCNDDKWADLLKQAGVPRNPLFA